MWRKRVSARATMRAWMINCVGAVDPGQRVAEWRLVAPVVWVWIAAWVGVVVWWGW